MSTYRIGIAAALASAAVLTGCSTAHSTDARPATAAAESSVSTTLTTSMPTASPRVPVPVHPETMSTEEVITQAVYEATGYWKARGVNISMPELRNGTSCTDGTASTVAVSCGTGSVIVYNLPTIQKMRDEVGNLAVLELFAHEVGHGVANAVGRTDGDTATWELRADCMSGAAISDQERVTPARAVEVFNRTEMANADGKPTKAFQTGYNAGRSGADTVQICTTYMG